MMFWQTRPSAPYLISSVHPFMPPAVLFSVTTVSAGKAAKAAIVRAPHNKPFVISCFLHQTIAYIRLLSLYTFLRHLGNYNLSQRVCVPR